MTRMTRFEKVSEDITDWIIIAFYVGLLIGAALVLLINYDKIWHRGTTSVIKVIENKDGLSMEQFLAKEGIWIPEEKIFDNNKFSKRYKFIYQLWDESVDSKNFGEGSEDAIYYSGNNPGEFKGFFFSNEYPPNPKFFKLDKTMFLIMQSLLINK